MKKDDLTTALMIAAYLTLTMAIIEFNPQIFENIKGGIIGWAFFVELPRAIIMLLLLKQYRRRL